ncbi:glycoside hydrolase family 32 protein [Gracilibacillus marinus]|uniref:Sucrose-6-phosphate hydrolase n=1 Tax=Gracilibacillus marinus TaxID=630535 RepID=A0ABV8VSI6_9BACI
MEIFNEGQLKKQLEKVVSTNREIVKQDIYYPSYHIAAPVGLINDPNGWIQWNGVYHLFYQWMPFHTGHGAKLWGHVTSTNLVDWKEEQPALLPTEVYDKDGCYSGSAIAYNNKLYLFYTGNVKKDGKREAYQCIAVSEDGIHFEKLGAVISVPEGYTAHFRDPKVWQSGEMFYLVLGAQRQDEIGCVVLYQSNDLLNWEFVNEIAGGYGYMWECPDYFQLDSRDVLIFSPQGLEQDGEKNMNTFQSGYAFGKWQEDKTLQLDSFIELDKGFDFYAPQTTLDEKGRRLLFGWMGMADDDEQYHPTHQNKWIHQLTIPRELVLKGEQIYQQPVAEMQLLRKEKLLDNEIIAHKYRFSLPRTVEICASNQNNADFTISIFGIITIVYSAKSQKITVSRNTLKNGEIEFRYGTVKNQVDDFHVFIDQSSLELFINNGEVVFSMRMFPDADNHVVEFNGNLVVSTWKL